MHQVFSGIPGLFWRLGLFFSLLATTAIMIWLQQQAPETVRIRQIDLNLQPGQSRIAGHMELAAPQADINHLLISRNTQGGWMLYNRSISHAAILEDGKTKEQMDFPSLTLAAGQILFLAGQPWRIEETSPALLLQNGQGMRWRYDNGKVAQPDTGIRPAAAPHQAGCPDQTFWSNIKFWQKDPLLIGGGANCSVYLPEPGLTPGSVRIEAKGNPSRYLLTATADSRNRVCVGQAAPAGTRADHPVSCTPLARFGLPVSDGDSLTIGYTRFTLKTEGDSLTFTPVSHIAKLATEKARLNQAGLQTQGITWHLQAEQPFWFGSSAGVLLAVVLAVSGLLLLVVRFHVQKHFVHFGQQLQHSTFLSYICLASVAVGILALVVVEVRLPLLLLAVLLFIAAPWGHGRGGMVFSLTGTLMLAAIVVQYALTLGAVDDGAGSAFSKTLLWQTLAFAVWAISLCVQALWQARHHYRPPVQYRPPAWESWFRQETKFIHMLYNVFIRGLPVITVLALFMQVLWGSEQGVFGFQPVELLKVTVVLVLAHLSALELERYRGRTDAQRKALHHWREHMGFLGLSILLALFTAGAGLLSVHDYSPLLLLACWLGALLIARAVHLDEPIGRFIIWLLGATLLLCPVILGITGYFFPESFSTFYAERFAVFLDPSHHQQSGTQYLRARTLMAESATLLAGSASAAVQAWQVPAIQFDFMPAFLGARFGGLAAAGLCLLQIAWLASLLLYARQCLPARDQRGRRHDGMFCYFALTSWAGMMFGQIVIAWSSNLGFLPVMGQPMPFLGFGSSFGVTVAGFLLLMFRNEALQADSPR